MRRSKDGKGRSVYAEVGFWMQSDGDIHMTIQGLENGHVTVTADPKRTTGHRTLYKRLSDALRQMGAPSPHDLENN